MKKYAVVHIIDSFATGGLEKQVYNMMRYGHADAYVICLSKDGHFGDELQALGKKVFYLASGDSVLKRLLEVYKIIKRNPVEVIHAHNQKAYFYASVIGHLSARTQVIMSKHGETFVNARVSGTISNYFLKHDPIIAVSKKIRLMCHEKFGGDLNRIVVVANGSPFQDYCEKKLSADKPINIGSVGRLAKVKNYALLIKAFAKLAQQHSQVTLTIVGDGPERKNLEKLVDSLDLKSKVIFAGLQQDVGKFLQAMDIFVISSDSEGLPLALLEAASHSLPVVSTEVGAIPDVLQHQESALLSPPGDEQALFENIRSCVDDSALRNSLAHASYQKLKAIYSIEGSINAHNEIYAGLKKS